MKTGKTKQRKIKGCVSIAIDNEYIPNIYHIKRRNNRIMETRVETGKGINNLSIPNTYGPQMQYS